MRSAAAATSFILLAGCARGEPPAPDAAPSLAPAELAPAPEAAPPTSAAPIAPSPSPALLPQTHDAPQPGGAAFDGRVSAFWDAIVRDDPPAAMTFFFPLEAYRQVKDVADPAADWKHRLVAAYERDIHALHAQLGPRAARARAVGLDVPAARARWVEPGEEWNKVGYYRVFGSRLRFEVDGAAGAFDVKSLISWRGEWFIVHLSATK